MVLHCVCNDYPEMRSYHLLIWRQHSCAWMHIYIYVLVRNNLANKMCACLYMHMWCTLVGYIHEADWLLYYMQVCLVFADAISSFLNWCETFLLIISSERKLFLSLFIVSVNKSYCYCYLDCWINNNSWLGCIVFILLALCFCILLLLSNCSHFLPSIRIALSHWPFLLLLSVISSDTTFLPIVSQLNDMRLSFFMSGMPNTGGPPSCNTKTYIFF